MKITFVLPGIGFSGGIRTIFECSNRLIDRGHQVSIVYPLVLKKNKSSYGMKGRIFTLLSVFKRLLSGNQVRWFSLKANVIRIPYLWNINIIEKNIPEADIVVATAAETAYFVNSLGGKCGKKMYFVQHYELWEIWNNLDCWNKLEQQKMDSTDMPKIIPEGIRSREYKDRVDTTYSMPFKVFSTSSWLNKLISKNFDMEIVGSVDIGNNNKYFCPDNAAQKNGNLILMPFRGEVWRGDNDGIRAFELVKEKYPEIHFVLYGTLSNRTKAPSWAKYYSDISDEKLRELYRRADIFVLPSWVEGWCSPPMEAMSCGTACVCTNVGAIPDYAIDQETALIVPPRDPLAIANACMELLRDGKKRNRIATAGFEHIKPYTWERTAVQMEKIFEKVLDKSAI
ncbi:MAG: glycosyltransferase family 4 protein [Candidatus Margulisiibacteriota bacterium]